VSLALRNKPNTETPQPRPSKTKNKNNFGAQNITDARYQVRVDALRQLRAIALGARGDDELAAAVGASNLLFLMVDIRDSYRPPTCIRFVPLVASLAYYLPSASTTTTTTMTTTTIGGALHKCARALVAQLLDLRCGHITFRSVSFVCRRSWDERNFVGVLPFFVCICAVRRFARRRVPSSPLPPSRSGTHVSSLTQTRIVGEPY
jgi:hypothetical protein